MQFHFLQNNFLTRSHNKRKLVTCYVMLKLFTAKCFLTVLTIHGMIWRSLGVGAKH